MTETTEAVTLSTDQPNEQEQPTRGGRTPRVYQGAAWVAIVAGVVFIVGAVFFTGFALGRHSDGGPGWHRGDHGPKAVRLMPMGPPGMGPEDGPRGPEGRPGGPEGGPRGAMRPDGPMGPGGEPQAPSNPGNPSGRP